MPISYNQEQGSWSATDLTKDEETSLINIAVGVIIDALGEQTARKLMEAAGARFVLEDTDKADMFNA
jgi:hypothetical protein